MPFVLSFNFLPYLCWMALAPHRSKSLARAIRGVFDKALLSVTWGIRKRPPAFHFPDLRALLSLLFFPRPFFGFTCTFPFAHTCPHRASGINLAELKIINPVVEEGVLLTCAEAHLLTPSFRCILRVGGPPPRFIFITTMPCISFTCLSGSVWGKLQPSYIFK